MNNIGSEHTGDMYHLDFYKSLQGKQALDQRLVGRLPIIEIVGHPFFVDVRLGELRPKDNFLSPGLDLGDGGYYDYQQDRHFFYYDIAKMTEADINAELTKLPKGVVQIAVPGELTLDPVAVARREGLAPDYYLKDYPLLMFQTAEVIPLEKTYLAELVKKNLEKLPKRPVKTKKSNRKKGL